MGIWPFHRRGQTAQATGQAGLTRPQDVLIVCHSADALGQSVMENICAGLDFGKIPFSILDISRGTSWPTLNRFNCIVLCTEMIWELAEQKAAGLTNFVAEGGGLLVASRGWHEHLSALLGFSEQVRAEPAMHMTNGLHFAAEIFPGTAGLTIADADWVFDHSRFDLMHSDLRPECKILATDLADRPILWRHDFGAGKVCFWNTGILLCRALRGIAIQTLLGTLPAGACAVGGFAMFHVDDFPPSLSEDRLEPVTTEFPHLDWNGFFFGAWHEDMMALREKYGLKYTWYVVMNYYDVDTRPGAQLDSHELAAAKDVLSGRFRAVEQHADDDEYGFHGYNHVPLITDSWPDMAALRSKLKLARTFWQDHVPAPMPTSWVPANNWYHADHVQVLAEVFPEISVVGSLLSSGEPEIGEYREFGPEPWNPALLCLPRETYGYILKPETTMMMLSQIAGMGVWTHFVHPDDIYDIPDPASGKTYARNPDTLMWRQTNRDGKQSLVHELDAWLAKVHGMFPWLEFLTTSQAEARYRAHIGNEVSIRTTSRTIQITTGTPSLYYMRLQQDTLMANTPGSEIVDTSKVDGGWLHVVRCPAGESLFEF